jgi:hypothetical protein
LCSDIGSGPARHSNTVGNVVDKLARQYLIGDTFGSALNDSLLSQWSHSNIAFRRESENVECHERARSPVTARAILGGTPRANQPDVARFCYACATKLSEWFENDNQIDRLQAIEPHNLGASI